MKYLPCSEKLPLLIFLSWSILFAAAAAVAIICYVKEQFGSNADETGLNQFIK